MASLEGHKRNGLMPLSAVTTGDCPLSCVDSGLSLEATLLLVFKASLNHNNHREEFSQLDVQCELSPKQVSLCHSDDLKNQDLPGTQFSPGLRPSAKRITM